MPRPNKRRTRSTVYYDADVLNAILQRVAAAKRKPATRTISQSDIVNDLLRKGIAVDKKRQRPV